MMIRKQHLTGHISSVVTFYDYYIALTEDAAGKHLTVMKAGSPDQTVVWKDGVNGTNGTNGVGIASVVMDDDYKLKITLTDGSTYTTPSLRGGQGVKGDKGDTGDTGLKGEKGDKGDTGEPGVYIGSGDMPEGYSVQIDPDGTPIDMHGDIDELQSDVTTLKQAAADVYDKDLYNAELYRVIDLKAYTKKVGVINNSGVAQSNNNYLYSDYLPVCEGCTIEFVNIKCASGYNMLSFYTSADSSGYESGVSGKGVTTASQVTTLYEVTKDGFVRICVKDDSLTEARAEMKSALNTTLDKMRVLSNLSTEVGDGIKLNGYLSSVGAIESGENAGKFKSNESYVYSAYIPVLKGWVIECEGVKCSTAYNAVSFYKDCGESHYEAGIAGVGINAANELNTEYKCLKDGYIRLCSKSGSQYLGNSSFTIKSSLYQKLDTMDDGSSEIKRYVGEATTALYNRNKDRRLLNFALITDTHMYPEAVNFKCEKNVRLFAAVANFTDFAVHCGDVAESGNMTQTGLTEASYVAKPDNWRNACRFLTLAGGIKVPLYVCHGNHDVNRYTYKQSGADVTAPWENAVTGEEWNYLFAPLTGSVVRNAGDSSGNYYYVDFEQFKCRVVIVDYFATKDEDGHVRAVQGCSNAEKTWMESTALDEAGKTGWTFLLFSHARQITSLAAKIASIRRNQANSIVLIHGNDHVDDFTNAVFADGTTTGEYADAIFCDIGIDNGFVKSWMKRELEYCVSIFSIDFENGKIYEKRLGRGSDREFKFGPANTTAANNIVTA